MTPPPNYLDAYLHKGTGVVFYRTQVKSLLNTEGQEEIIHLGITEHGESLSIQDSSLGNSLNHEWGFLYKNSKGEKNVTS